MILILSHAGPAQLAVRDVFPGKGALCRGQAVDIIAVCQPRLLRVCFQSFGPQLLSDLGEGHIAGVCEGVTDVLLPVGAGADDGLVPDLHAALAGPGAVLQVRQFLQRRRQRHCLIDGARREGGGQEPVQVRALVPVVGLDIRGDMQRVIAGSGDHTENLSRLVIVHCHRARVAVQGLVGLVIVPGVDGQIQVAPPVGAEGAVQQTVARQLVGKGVQGAGANIAL